MKKIILLIGILVMIIAVTVSFGQPAEGVITYEIRMNLHRNIPEDRQDMKAMVPEFRVFKQQLFFNAQQSFYKPLIEDEDDEDNIDNRSGGMRMVFRQRMEIYTETGTGKVLSAQEFMGKDYLIEDSVKVDPWKMGTETKTILGYECRQSYYTNEERKQTVTAWYTDALRPFLGPDRANTLPGSVLAVDINNGERVTIARKIDLRGLKKSEMKVPSDGIKTTSVEFRKMVQEQMKNRPGGGRVIIQN